MGVHLHSPAHDSDAPGDILAPHIHHADGTVPGHVGKRGVAHPGNGVFGGIFRAIAHFPHDTLRGGRDRIRQHLQDAFNAEIRGIDDHGIGGGLERRNGPVAVHVVALADHFGDLREIGGLALGLQLLKTAHSAHFRPRVKEELEPRRGEHHGPHVAAFGDETGLPERPLRFFQAIADHRGRGEARSEPPDFFGTDFGAHGHTVAQQYGMFPAALQLEAEGFAARPQFVFRQRFRARPEAQGYGAEHGAGVQIGNPENGGEALGEGGFADPGGAVQCDDRQTLHDYSSSRIALISIVFSSAVPTETRRFRGRP